MHRTVSLLLCLAVARPAFAQRATDPEVIRGIREVDEGDLNAGILTLDAAVRRLARDPARARDLGQAHLYLGIAYVGKGQEGLARVQFREAATSIPELTLNPADYPPKVIELFDAAKRDVGASSPGPAASTPPKKKGGSKLPLILGGIAVAGGAGIAVAAGGGGNADTPAAMPTVILMEAGTVIRGTSRRQYSLTIPRSGTLEVAVMWAEPDALVTVELYQPPASQVLQSSTPTTAMSPQRLTTAIAAGAYRIDVFLRTASAPISVGNVANYTIEVKLR